MPIKYIGIPNVCCMILIYKMPLEIYTFIHLLGFVIKKIKTFPYRIRNTYMFMYNILSYPMILMYKIEHKMYIICTI